MFAPQKELNWLYVDFDSFFASVEQQLNPEFRGKPIAVVPTDTDATCAIAASYEAKAYGIKTGTMIYEAKKICPDLICVQADHAHYTEFHESIVEVVDSVIPVTKVCSIDEMACKLMSNENSLESVTALAHRIKCAVADNIGEYVRCSIGIAPNKYLSKIASDMDKPNGLTILQAGKIKERLLTLELKKLSGIGRQVEARLNRAGIYKMDQLLNLEPKHMRKIWGSLWGEKMYYYLRGYDLPDAETNKSSIGHSHVLAPEMRPPTKAWIIAKRLTNKATARLRRSGYYAEAFSLSVRTEDEQKFKTEIVCKASQDSFSFLNILENMWQELLPSFRNKRVKKISVNLSRLTKENQVQQDLFDFTPKQENSQEKQKCEKLSGAIDVLNQKFGKDTISLGLAPNQGKSFTGTKIAFSRIPEMEEFLE